VLLLPTHCRRVVIVCHDDRLIRVISVVKLKTLYIYKYKFTSPIVYEFYDITRQINYIFFYRVSQRHVTSEKYIATTMIINKQFPSYLLPIYINRRSSVIFALFHYLDRLLPKYFDHFSISGFPFVLIPPPLS